MLWGIADQMLMHDVQYLFADRTRTLAIATRMFDMRETVFGESDLSEDDKDIESERNPMRFWEIERISREAFKDESEWTKQVPYFAALVFEYEARLRRMTGMTIICF